MYKHTQVPLVIGSRITYCEAFERARRIGKDILTLNQHRDYLIQEGKISDYNNWVLEWAYLHAPALGSTVEHFKTPQRFGDTSHCIPWEESSRFIPENLFFDGKTYLFLITPREIREEDRCVYLYPQMIQALEITNENPHRQLFSTDTIFPHPEHNLELISFQDKPIRMATEADERTKRKEELICIKLFRRSLLCPLIYIREIFVFPIRHIERIEARVFVEQGDLIAAQEDIRHSTNLSDAHALTLLGRGLGNSATINDVLSFARASAQSFGILARALALGETSPRQVRQELAHLVAAAIDTSAQYGSQLAHEGAELLRRLGGGNSHE